MFSLNLFIADEMEMLALGGRLANEFKTSGGAGKTTLARGFLYALGHKGKVKSPTYTLVEPYYIPGHPVFHFDLYRLSDPEELEFVGIRDYLDPTAILLIEWPERGRGMLPNADIVVQISFEKHGRGVKLTEHSVKGSEVLGRIS